MTAVVVTGVSSGIGWGTAKVLIHHGVQVFGSVRREADANRLSAEFGDLFTPLLSDITDQDAVQRGAEQVREQLRGSTLSGLVNNAAASFTAPLIDQPIPDIRQQIDINLIGPMIVTQAFLPQLGTDPSLRGQPGRIVNLSSVGVQLEPPFLGSYVASKAGLEGLSSSLRRELTPFGIDVVIVAPGSVATATWDKAQVDVDRWASHPVYGAAIQKFASQMIKGGRAGSTPEQLGEIIWNALTVPRAALRYTSGRGSALNSLILQLLPKRLLDSLLIRQVGLTRRTGKKRNHTS